MPYLSFYFSLPCTFAFIERRFQSMQLHTVVIFSLVLLVSACSSIPKNQQTSPITQQQISKREYTLQSLTDWQLQGKIAFIQPGKREKANINWRYQTTPLNQKLNLTTYLGINVLQLKSKNGRHTVEVDGDEYHSDNLSQLIYSLTGLTLPTQALTYWLKGIPFTDSDVIVLDQASKLPSQLTSLYNDELWQISYKNYQNINGYLLAKNFIIKQQQLTIKIQINHWNI